MADRLSKRPRTDGPSCTRFADLRSVGIDQRKVTLVERFDPRTLAFLASLTIDDHMRAQPGLAATKAQARVDLAKRYAAAVGNADSLTVTYRQSSMGGTIGRYFADRGLSQQGMSRTLRHTLARHIYFDLDFVNCHPVILDQLCKRIGHDAPFLSAYAADRASMIKKMAMPADEAKEAVCAAINGSARVPDVLGWDQLMAELKGAREAVLAAAPRISAWIRQNPSKVKKDEGISIVLNDIENQCVLALAEFLQAEGLEVGTLCFDGLQVAQNDRIDEALLVRASEFVFEQTGFRLAIAIKPMDRGLVVPAEFESPSKAPLADTHLKAAELLLKMLGGAVARCGRRFFVRGADLVWTEDSFRVEDELLRRALTSGISRAGADGQRVLWLEDVPAAKNAVKALRAITPDDAGFYARLWRSSLGKLVFRNGVFDFEAGGFGPHDPDAVMTTLRIDRDFSQSRNPLLEAEVRRRVVEAAFVDEGRVDTLLQTLARGVAGCLEDKTWAIAPGGRNSGKGTLTCTALLEAALGPYVATTNGENFQFSPAGGDAAAQQKWMSVAEFTRIVVSSEISMDESVDRSRRLKLDGNRLKKFASGGDAIKMRGLWEAEHEIRLQGRLLMMCNDLPEVTPADALQTALVFNFQREFNNPDERPGRAARGSIEAGFARAEWELAADPGIKDFCRRPDVADAFLWLLIDAYKGHAVRPSAAVRDDTEKFVAGFEVEGDLYDQAFEFTDSGEHVIIAADLKKFIATNRLNVGVQKVSKELERRGAVHYKHAAGRNRSGWLKVRFRSQSADCN